MFLSGQSDELNPRGSLLSVLIVLRGRSGREGTAAHVHIHIVVVVISVLCDLVSHSLPSRQEEGGVQRAGLLAVLRAVEVVQHP